MISPLYDLILQCKVELQTETVQVADADQAWGMSAIPTASVALCVWMRGVMALQLSLHTLPKQGFLTVLDGAAA